MLKKINEFRRILTKGLTKNIGKTGIERNKSLVPGTQVYKVLVSRPNHRLGNMLLATPLIQEIAGRFPGCRIDLFVKGNIAPLIFKNYTNVGKITSLPRKPFKELFQYIKVWVTLKTTRYDLVINAVNNSSSGRLSTLFARSKYKFYGEIQEDMKQQHKDYGHIAKLPVYNLRNTLAQLGFALNDGPVPLMDLKLSASEKAAGLEIVKELVKNEKETICLFTYATGEKCYSETWWEPFYERLKSAYPDFNIIEILPAENISLIARKAPTFYSRDIREIASVMANTKVFIGADSGIMHLASAAQVPVIGLFSVTNSEVYRPYNPGSVAVNTNQTGTDELMKIIDNVLYKQERKE